MRTLAFLFAAVSAVAVVACGDTPGNNGDIDARPAAIDAGTIDGNEGPPDADCVTDPVTPTEILNACTDAERIVKNPTQGCWDADGVLPTP